MDVVIDTDILSTFAKLKKQKLLRRIFKKSSILITPSVNKEIREGMQLRLVASQPIRFSRIKLNLSENRLVMEIRERRRLGLGDAECIAVAKQRGCLLITNDHDAEAEADSLSVRHVNLPLLLREMWVRKIMSKQQVIKLMAEIERKDRIVIKNKDIILKL